MMGRAAPEQPFAHEMDLVDVAERRSVPGVGHENGGHVGLGDHLLDRLGQQRVRHHPAQHQHRQLQPGPVLPLVQAFLRLLRVGLERARIVAVDPAAVPVGPFGLEERVVQQLVLGDRSLVLGRGAQAPEQVGRPPEDIVAGDRLGAPPAPFGRHVGADVVEHQPLHQVGAPRRQGHADAAAERGADDAGARAVQVVEQLDHRLHVGLDRVVALGRHPAAHAAPRPVQADHVEILAQPQRQVVPAPRGVGDPADADHQRAVRIAPVGEGQPDRGVLDLVGRPVPLQPPGMDVVVEALVEPAVERLRGPPGQQFVLLPRHRVAPRQQGEAAVAAGAVGDHREVVGDEALMDSRSHAIVSCSGAWSGPESRPAGRGVGTSAKAASSAIAESAARTPSAVSAGP